MNRDRIKAFIEKVGVDEVLNCIDYDDVLDHYDRDDLSEYGDDDLIDELEERGYCIGDEDDKLYHWNTKGLLWQAIINIHGRGICTPQRAKELVIDYIEDHFTCSINCNRNKD